MTSDPFPSIPTHQPNEAQPLLGHPSPGPPPTPKRAFRRLTVRRTEEQLLILIAILLFIFGIDLLFTALSELSFKVKPVTPPIQLPTGVKHSWAQYTPYYSASAYTNPPSQCTITQVNILQRHGARFPATDEDEPSTIRSAIEKLKGAVTYLDPRLEFVEQYDYELDEDDLVAFGAAQSFDSGQYDFLRYKNLVNNSNLPFVRASGARRVVDSAMNWTAGFGYASRGKAVPSLDLIIEESPEFNNTLNIGCPNTGGSEEQTRIWESVYATSIAARLNASAPGANVTASDVTNLMKLCALETLAQTEPSNFCGLFDQSDFEDFEYFGDLDKYYGNGYGEALGPVQGVGYINELIARLTDSPVHDHTQTNRTLDSDTHTFPLERPVYADFTHENLMISVYSAMGLFRPERDLDPWCDSEGGEGGERVWNAGRLVPFSARLVVERLECGGERAVRVLVNDRLQSLEFCGAADEEGMGLGVGICKLDAFVRSQGYARRDGEGDFEKCFFG